MSGFPNSEHDMGERIRASLGNQAKEKYHFKILRFPRKNIPGPAHRRAPGINRNSNGCNRTNLICIGIISGFESIISQNLRKSLESHERLSTGGTIRGILGACPEPLPVRYFQRTYLFFPRIGCMSTSCLLGFCREFEDLVQVRSAGGEAERESAGPSTSTGPTSNGRS
eukprot:669231-Amorphochlora_amoeboformis.AAC.2